MTRPFRRRRRTVEEPASTAPLPATEVDASPPVPIAADDPLLAHLAAAGDVVDLETLELDSPALRELKAAGVKLTVPLVSQGELIGLLHLGPRLSEQEYSSDDRRLLGNLATQVAPAFRVGQLVREQEAEAATRQRFEQELEVARLIQQNFLPKELPELPGWQIAAHYSPAREVGGDFYDVIPLPGGRLAFVIGDVTDKGVPAALVMAATRSVLRTWAQRLADPGAVLAAVNEQMCPDMPERMFVTCLYAVLDPETGLLRFANAGHDLPTLKTAGGLVELRARGMPLGLMPGMDYEETEATIQAGESLLLHSDGVIEAHDPHRAMFGAARLREIVGASAPGQATIDRVLSELEAFTGPGADQEDDITMVSVERSGRRLLAEIEIDNEEGNERRAIREVEAAAAAAGFPAARIEQLKTAVGEATMNAMEHGNGYEANQPVKVSVLIAANRLHVLVTDHGGRTEPPKGETPDLDAKLAGLQTPRGWGLFLIEEMVDEVRTFTDGDLRTVELVMHLQGAGHAE